jgi:hypothetical protein
MAWIRRFYRWLIDADVIEASKEQNAEWRDMIERTDPECKHLESYIRRTDLFGYAYCPKCDALIPLSTWLSNLTQYLRGA